MIMTSHAARVLRQGDIAAIAPCSLQTAIITHPYRLISNYQFTMRSAGCLEVKLSKRVAKTGIHIANVHILY